MGTKLEDVVPRLMFHASFLLMSGLLISCDSQAEREALKQELRAEIEAENGQRPAKTALHAESGTRAGEKRADPLIAGNWTWIPGGTFSLGCENGDKACEHNELPLQPAQQVKAFWLMETEVTVEAFAKCVTAGHCPGDRQNVDSNSKEGNFANGRSRHPINYVTIGDAKAFCSWLGARLPSANEWEYACKSGRSVIFPWGNADPSLETGNGWDRGSPHNELSKPVGFYPAGATAWGLLDMGSNVDEWTSSEILPGVPEVRGGHYGLWDKGQRCSSRSIFSEVMDWSRGFRCAR